MACQSPPYAVYNIGNNNPENLLDFVTILQTELIRAHVLPSTYTFESHKELVPMQAGDIPITYADTTTMERDSASKHPHASETVCVFCRMVRKELWYMLINKRPNTCSLFLSGESAFVVR